MIAYLVTKAATGKIRGCIISWDEKWHDDIHGHLITRETYQLFGKHTTQPDIIITKGKANRNHREQALLQFNHEVKVKLDKGYKEIDKDPELCSEAELLEFLGDVKTDQFGFAKHMLAKSADKISQSTIDKVPYWYASRKIDGVRGGMFWDGKAIHIESRGGGNYDCAMQQFRENEDLINFFKVHPDFILDGEIYKHGWSLQKISGEARKCETMLGSNDLEFYIYDIMIPGKTFEERLDLLNIVTKSLNLGFDPNREWEKDELRMQIVPHEKVSKYDNIITLHNNYVEEGWEGVVCRNPSKEYGFGKRTNDMLKFKAYRDDCFTVVGIQQGLRKYEDMVFILTTKDGIEFKAKPFGDLGQKIEYTENFENKYLGKIGECKFFYYSDDGVPLQPSFRAFRFDLSFEDIK